MKTKLLIVIALVIISCDKNDTEDYDCGCTDELFITGYDEYNLSIVETIPIRLCELYPYETATSNHNGIPDNYLYSTILFGTDIKEISRSQGCYD